MKAELDKPSHERTKYDGESLKINPNTLELRYIREEIVRYGVDTKKASAEATKIENDLTTLSISGVGYNLESYSTTLWEECRP